MKKIFLALATISVLLVGCKKNNESSNVVPSELTERVVFTFKPYTMEPMRDDITSLINHLDVWIVEGENVYEYHQVKENNNSFCTLAVELNKTKTYTMYAIGHKANGVATLENGIITFPDNKVTHSMFYKSTFIPGTTTSMTCEMQRIVGMFKFVITDAIPEEIDHIEFHISESGTGLDVETVEVVNFMERIAIPSSMNPGSNGYVTLNIYIMADDMDSTKELDITVKAVTANNTVVEQHDFTEVPIKNGWITKYEGTFFVTTGMTMTFTVGGWEEFDPINF